MVATLDFLTEKECTHEIVYNFPSLPSKAICTKCRQKYIFDAHNLEWVEVDFFVNETRTDKELIEKWIRLN